MTQPFGFVAPVAIPAVGGALNVIIPTGGALAGAAIGAKYGLVGGVPGVAIGVAIGAVAGVLLLPSPTAPGTLPGIDPGLNGPELEPLPEAPPLGLPATTIEGPETDPPGTEYQWQIVLFDRWELSPMFKCSTGLQFKGRQYITNKFDTYDLGRGTKINISSIPRYMDQICGPTNSDQRFQGSRGKLWVFRDNAWKQISSGGSYNYGLYINRTNFKKEPDISRWEQWTILRDGVEQPIPEGLNAFKPDRPPEPRVVPIEPLPQPLEEPEDIPIPEPEELPEPVEVPEPDNPDREPVIIPGPLPAKPQPQPEPAPEPLPLPLPGPAIPLPLAVPEVAPIVQPQPEPQIIPVPQPGQQPEPGQLPQIIPTPLPTPIQVQPGPAQTPINSLPTRPGGEIIPTPTPDANITPPWNHFPVPGGPPVNGGGTRPDLGSIAAEVGRVEQKVAQMLKRKDPSIDIGDVLRLLGELLNYLENQKGGTEYTLKAVCECPEDDDECKEPELVIQTSGGDYRDETLARIDAIAEMLQPLKTWKQPICKDKPAQEGNWRTIEFKGDRNLPSGRSALTKIFRYRSKGSQDLEQLVNHWKDFTWQAGPVCVINKGLWWGVPQVWASSADEGRRVIAHAAVEAGINLDKSKWIYRSSKDPRYGLESTMSVRIYKNASESWYAITNRDEPSGRPLVMED